MSHPVRVSGVGIGVLSSVPISRLRQVGMNAENDKQRRLANDWALGKDCVAVNNRVWFEHLYAPGLSRLLLR